METEKADPIPLAEGVKCPHCQWGVFHLESRVIASPNGNPDGVQTWFWKCSWDERLKCQARYYPDTSEMEGRYYAIVDRRVKSVAWNLEGKS